MKVYDRNNQYVGSVSKDDPDIYDQNGKLKGRAHSPTGNHGFTFPHKRNFAAGKVWGGSAVEWGHINDRKGRKVGSIKRDGRVYDINNGYVGKVTGMLDDGKDVYAAGGAALLLLLDDYL